jgi:REP element-mobilizing transposase RayT
MNSERFRVSRDTPSLFITAVAKDRLPVFRSDTIKAITCRALDQARTSCGFLILAYVITLDHLHVVTNGPEQASVILRYIEGSVAYEVIEFLKRHRYEESLQKLRHEEWKRHHRYSLRGNESNVFLDLQ